MKIARPGLGDQCGLQPVQHRSDYSAVGGLLPTADHMAPQRSAGATPAESHGPEFLRRPSSETPGHMDVFLDNSTECAATRPLACVAVSRPLMAVTSEMLPTEAEDLQYQGTRYISLRRQQVLRIGDHLLADVLNDHGIRVNCLGFAGGFTGRSWKLMD